MATAVGTMWKINESKNATRIEQLSQRADDCEQDRSDLRVRVAKLEARVTPEKQSGSE
jgi:hypothetical protein